MATTLSITPTTFQHAPLADDEIRLLEILPRDSYGNLKLTMHTFVRADAPRYAALSYVWGPESKRIVFVNNAVFYVRKNLLDALTSINRRFEDISIDERVFERSELALETRKFIWVDAICIDQANIDERNVQVSLMKRTYAEAATVIVWLGMEEDDVNENTYPTIGDHKTWKWRENMRQLANRAYWGRIWVVQEFLVASDIIIVCGNHWLLERNFFDEVGRLPDLYTASRFSSMTTSARASNDYEAQSLDHMLNLYHDNDCSDPRDRVFALLGCIADQEQEALASYLPNYELSYDEVAIIALAHIMRWSGQVPTWDHVLFRGTRPSFADKMLKIAFAFEVCRGLPWRDKEKNFTDFGPSFRAQWQQLQDDLVDIGTPGFTGSQVWNPTQSIIWLQGLMQCRNKRATSAQHTSISWLTDMPSSDATYTRETICWRMMRPRVQNCCSILELESGIR